MVTSWPRLWLWHRKATKEWPPLVLPPFPFPPPPEDLEEVQQPASFTDGALLAAGIASLWTLYSLGSARDLTTATMAFAPIPVVAVLGALMAKAETNRASIVGPTVALAFGAVYGVLLCWGVAIWIELGRSSEAAAVALIMLVFGSFVGLLFLIVAVPAAVAWTLFMRELYAPKGTMRHLAKRGRRICIALVIAAILVGGYQVATVPWIAVSDWRSPVMDEDGSGLMVDDGPGLIPPLVP